MQFLSLIPALLDALVAIPKIGAMVTSACGAIASWWVQRQTQATLADIANAAALTARAQTDADRYAAADAWQKALQNSRVST